MRPRKVILCVDADECALSLRCLVLDTWGYRVLRATSYAAAIAILKECKGVTANDRLAPTLDLMITRLKVGSASGNHLVCEAKGLHPGLPCLVTSLTAVRYDGAADGFLPAGSDSASELIAQVKRLTERKRGPRKHFPLAGSGAAIVRPEVAA